MDKYELSERVLNVLEWDTIVSELESRCETVNGKKSVSELKPVSADNRKTRLKEISELKALISKGESPDLSGISDIEPLIQIILKGGILQIPDICIIKDCITASNRIISYLKKHKQESELLSAAFVNLDSVAELNELLASSITANNELSTNKYPELQKFRDQIAGLKTEIERKLHDIIYSPAKSGAIQEKIFTVRNDRYVILVKADMRGKIKGTMHDISSSGATLYIEPAEVLSLNNKLIILERDYRIEVNRILRQICSAIAGYSDELILNQELLAKFDFLTAASKFSIAIKGNEPEISGDNVINLLSARHPLLYMMNPENVVSNDISLGKEYKCMIISGANTGGKTVLLKTVGLCVLLAMHGLHIPASPDSALGAFNNILADIGDDQNIVQSLSTYSGQIVILNQMIKTADKNTLVLIDELLAGTNPKQGAVIAQAVLEALAGTNAVLMVATHYSELKELPSDDQRFVNASVAFDIDSLKPTYKLRTGLPGTSYALEIARNYGMDENILQRAKDLLDSKEISTEALLENIQKHRQEIDEEYSRIAQIKEELNNEKNKLNEQNRELNIKASEIKRKHGIDFIEEIRKYKEEINLKLKSLRNESIKELESVHHDLSKIQKNLNNTLKENRKNEILNQSKNPALSGDEKPGTGVFVIPLEKNAIIDEIDKINKTAVIIIGNSIRSRYSFKDLLVSDNFEKKKPDFEKKQKKENAFPESTPVTIQTSLNTSDLRGLRVEDALNKLESDLDRMMRNNISAAVVIHGHGTGALKKAVREWLNFSCYAASFRPGKQYEGGDGVSIVLLKE
ncbi:MAG: Smr/MutS family protein [Spirochaetes bacterium]|nr:Smr/MutS family protein [Spirochaetota bacterium]